MVTTHNFEGYEQREENGDLVLFDSNGNEVRRIDDATGEITYSQPVGSGDYKERVESNGDLVLEDPNGTVVKRWDVDAGEWVFPAVSTGNISNIRVVGPAGFDTLQAAHDDLPSDGGLVLMTEGTTETATTLSKPVRVVGSNGAARRGTADSAVVIDTSGGSGLTIGATGVTVEDIEINGDSTGGDGLTVTTNGINLRNVEVTGKGGDGAVFSGDVQSGFVDITASGNSGVGIRLDTSPGNYVSDMTFRLSAFSNGSHGILVTSGGLFAGNVFTRLHSVNNSGWGMRIEGSGQLIGNTFSGYGFEANNSGSFYADGDRIGGASNEFVVSEAKGAVDTISGYWDQFAIVDRESPPDVLGVSSGEVSFGLKDDWGDGRLTAREGGTAGRYVDHPERPVAGFYRPSWVTLIGSPTAVSGALSLPAGDQTNQEIMTRSSMVTGTFETTFAFDSTPTSGGFNIRIIQDDDAGEFYVIGVDANGDVTLGSFASGSFDGTLASGSWPVDTNEHTVTATRDTSGNWELLFDGESQGTGTDSNLPTNPDGPQFRHAADADIEVRSVDWR